MVITTRSLKSSKPQDKQKSSEGLKDKSAQKEEE